MSNAVENYISIINELHREWIPHEGQIEIGSALIEQGFKQVMAQCGRNFGKTELVVYLLWRWALSNPGSENYYFAPFMKQAREIIWSPGRLQDFGDRRHLSQSPEKSEMRLSFCNGSFIKCDGSDNFEAYRGVKPSGLVIYDEYKDFRKEFHEAFDPNLVAKGASLLVVGTPPKIENHFTRMATEFRTNRKKRFFEMPTSRNPHIDRGWLADKKEEYRKRGELDVWEREYMGKFVRGGSDCIFPMLSRDQVYRHEVLLKEIERDKKKLRWFCIADPGTTTCFGILFGAVNVYTKNVYLFDEIYETRQAETSVDKVGKRIRIKQDEFWPVDDDWLNVADNAAQWFILEIAERFDMGFLGTNKMLRKKEACLSLIKDCLLNGRMKFSDRCKMLYWEMENYVKDEDGEIPKENDHLIDCLRYALDALGYSLNTSTEPISVEKMTAETKRYYTPEEDKNDIEFSDSSDLDGWDEL